MERRMRDRMAVLRFLAFHERTYVKAKSGLKRFLNEFMIDSLKRNVASPMYAVDEGRMENLEKLSVIDELKLIKSQLETMTETITKVENKINDE